MSIKHIVFRIVIIIGFTGFLSGCTDKNIVIEVEKNTILVDGEKIESYQLDSILQVIPDERKEYPVKLYVSDDAEMGAVSDIKVSLRKNKLLKVKYFN